MVRTEDGMRLVPEMYAVPNSSVGAEYQNPGSQKREVVGRCPFLWGQSLYILGKLLQEVSEKKQKWCATVTLIKGESEVSKVVDCGDWSRL